jgi:UDP-N-acetylmuramoylalanine--D-glutamate ligase
MNYRDYFKGKKITQVGLGLLGRGVGDAEFLIECGVDLIVTDMKTEEQLKSSVEKLQNLQLKTKNYQLHLGGHRMEDFSAQGGRANPDFILKGAGVPLDSPYIAEARKNNIPIEMSTSLFVKLLPKNTKTVGVTGTRGKSTTTMMIYEVLNRIKNKVPMSALPNRDPDFFLQKNIGKSRIKGGRKIQVFLGGNVRDKATLPLLKEIDSGDDMENFVVMELDSWQLQGFGESKISPNVAVFTTFMPDHMNYYGGSMEKYFDDKANIFEYQNQESGIKNQGKREEDTLVVGEQILEVAEKYYKDGIPERALVARVSDFSADWSLKILGEHNKQNAICAILALRALGIPEDIIKEGIENFSAVEGRLQLFKELNGVKIYNDNNATTPEAVIVALKAINEESGIKNKELRKDLGEEKRIVLILGGADKGLDLSKLVEAIGMYCKAVVLLPGSGTERIKNNELRIKVEEVKDLNGAVKKAMEFAKKGDTVLFSPGFASFGLFANEYERNDKFVKIIKSL